MLGAKLTESTEVVVPHFTRRCSWSLLLADCFVQKQVCFLRDCISNATRKLSCDPSNFPMNPSPVERPTKRICNPPIPGHHHSNRWHSVLLYHIDRQSNRVYRMATRSYKSKQNIKKKTDEKHQDWNGVTPSSSWFELLERSPWLFLRNFLASDSYTHLREGLPILKPYPKRFFITL